MKFRLFYAVATLLAALAVAGCSDDDHKHHTPDKSYRVGDLYQKDGVKGVVYKISDEGRHGMIVSLDQTKAQWAIEDAGAQAVGATDDYDGLKNMQAVMAVDGWREKYPAFAWCDAKNTAGVSGWVLPAYYQLRDLYDAYAADKVKFDKFLTDNGGTPIAVTSTDDQDYWSSTEDIDSSVFATSFEFYQGNADFPFKTDTERVRAVRAF